MYFHEKNQFNLKTKIFPFLISYNNTNVSLSKTSRNKTRLTKIVYVYILYMYIFRPDLKMNSWIL